MQIDPRPSVLNLFGDRQNIGGIVNLFNMLEPLDHSARYRQIHYRVGRLQHEPRYSNPLVRLWDFLSNLVKYTQVLQETQPDVVHINLSLNRRSIYREYAFVMATRISGFKGGILTFVHGWEPSISDHFGNRNLTNYCIRKILNNSGRIIVLGEWFRRQLVSFHIPENIIHVMPTAVPVEELTKISASRDGKNAEEFRFLFLSRLDRTKGIFELIQAFDQLRQRHPGRKLVLEVAGDGHSRLEFEKELEQNPIPEVILSGYLRGDEKRKALQRADAFVLPTYYGEGCPVALLEAMAVGLPVITTEDGGIPDVVENEVNGLIVEKRSVSSLLEAMERSLIDGEWTKIAGDRNAEKARLQFDILTFQKRLESIYDEVIQNDR